MTFYILFDQFYKIRLQMFSNSLLFINDKENIFFEYNFKQAGTELCQVQVGASQASFTKLYQP